MNANPPPRPRFSSRRPPPRRATARRGRPGGLRIGEWVRAGGTSGVVRLSMSGTTGSLVGRYGYDLVWMCDSLDADTFPEEGFAETTNLVAYTIFREPLSPWTNEWTNVQNAWTNALEFALVTALGVAETSIVRIPCLYPLPNIGATGWNDVSTLEPNPVNMTVLVSQNGSRRILVPLPRFIVFAEKLGETFIDLGYSEDEVLFVESAGPRGWFGEVHCATNVNRSRGQ